MRNLKFPTLSSLSDTLKEKTLAFFGGKLYAGNAQNEPEEITKFDESKRRQTYSALAVTFEDEFAGVQNISVNPETIGWQSFYDVKLSFTVTGFFELETLGSISLLKISVPSISGDDIIQTPLRVVIYNENNEFIIIPFSDINTVAGEIQLIIQTSLINNGNTIKVFIDYVANNLLEP